MSSSWYTLSAIILGCTIFGTWFQVQSTLEPTTKAQDVTAEWKKIIEKADYNSFQKPVISALTQRYQGRSAHPMLVDYIAQKQDIPPSEALNLAMNQSRYIDSTIIQALGDTDGTISTAAFAYLCTLKTKHLQLLYQQLQAQSNKQIAFLGTLALGCLPSPYAEEALFPLENSPEPHIATAVKMAFERKGLLLKD